MKPSEHSLSRESFNADRVFNLTWLGPTDGDCAHMLDRVRQTCAEQGRRLRLHSEPLVSTVLQAALQSFDSPVVAWADRVIVASETRLDYPWRVVELLERLDSGVPWGVATGTWHAGSRRTGIGPVTHWQLPWYQWWDGWYGWLFPERARPDSRSAAQFEPVIAPIDLATPAKVKTGDLAAQSSGEPIIELMPGPVKQILIVSACRETGQAWQLSAEKVGWDSVAEHPQRPSEASSQRVAAELHCILWDDSCQDCLPDGDHQLQQACRQIGELKRSYPLVPIVAGLSLLHLPNWKALQQAGASDFIIKPSFGLPLADFLWAQFAAETGESRDRRDK